MFLKPSHFCTWENCLMLRIPFHHTLAAWLHMCVCVRICGFYYSIMFNHVTYLIFKSRLPFCERTKTRRREKNDACSFSRLLLAHKPFFSPFSLYFFSPSKLPRLSRLQSMKWVEWIFHLSLVYFWLELMGKQGMSCWCYDLSSAFRHRSCYLYFFRHFEWR